MMGIQNVAAIFCIPLIPYCWDTKYGSHILYPLKDQRGDTEYGRHIWRYTGVASDNVSLKKCVGIQNMTGGAIRFCIPC